VIDLNVVKNIVEADLGDGQMAYKEGLVSLGSFDEGICFKLSLKTGKSYIICNPKEKLINSMMSFI